MAITNQAFDSVQELLDFCLQYDCPALEYTFQRNAHSDKDVSQEVADIETLLRTGLKLRYHLAFPNFELGHPDPERAREAVAFYISCLKIIENLDGDRATLHIGLDSTLRERLNYERAIQGLQDLVVIGESLNIRVCLENLRLGKTGNPYFFQSLIQKSGAWATLDVGHARARELASNDNEPALDFIHQIGNRLIGSHIYEIEKAMQHFEPARHFPPQDLSGIGPILDAMLRQTECDWWVIELMDTTEMANVLQLLRNYQDTFRMSSTIIL